MRWHPGQKLGGIAGEQAYVADVMGLDLGQDLSHAVDIGFAANKTRVRKCARFRDQMFAAAESDFEPDAIDRSVEYFSEIGRARCRDVEGKARQQMFDQISLVLAQFVALAAPEERTMGASADAVVGRRVSLRRIA